MKQRRRPLKKPVPHWRQSCLKLEMMAKRDSPAKELVPSKPDPSLANLPPEVKKKLEEIKGKLDKFHKELLKKFEDYIVGVALMPPPRPEDVQAQQQVGQQGVSPPLPGTQPPLPQPGHPKLEDQIFVMVLVDDSDSTKMPKHELRDKLISIVDEMAKKSDDRLRPSVILLSELWQSCYDGKVDLLQLIALSAPVYDTGMLAAIKIAEIHKTMVLKKFEKYIVSYVLFGSLTRGEATSSSDIDVSIIIDDTDVKKMTRAELKDKLRAIIIGMGIEAGDLTGIKNKLNIQVYILTEFWDSVKEANPVIFTILRDGVPFYDRGLFMPWKQLLRMGRIKPSREAIDMFMATGEQMVSRVKLKLRDIIEQDMYWATLTPSQAALMMYGIPPPTPEETITLLNQIFVEKEGLLEPKFIETMRDIRKYYKGLEHGNITEISGKEIDDLLKRSDEFLKRIKKLFGEIELIKEREEMVHAYESVVTIARDVLLLEGVDKASDEGILKMFESELVSSGKVPVKYLRILDDLLQGKKDYDTGKLTRTEIDKIKKSTHELIKFLVEYIQRKRGKDLERARVKVKRGKTFGEILFLDKEAFIIHDIDAEEKHIDKAMVREDGSLGNTKESSLEEMEKALAKAKIPSAVFLSDLLFEDLKKVFGKDVEVLVNRA